jgi:hypothetical protein
MALAMPDGLNAARADWTALDRELDLWAAAGRVATFWWRDDDARAPGPALDRLLALRAELDAPLALAVVPAGIDPGLAARLAPETAVSVLQHGYSHKNFASEGARKIELDGSRPTEYVIADLAVGGQALARFARHLPVLVPPWNRIAPHLLPMLPELGYRGLSTLGPRAREFPLAGLKQNNVHLDPVDWRGKRSGRAGGFAGTDAMLSDAIEHLSARRTGAVDAGEASGLMTHHAVMDDAIFAFAREFVARTRAHGAAAWLSAGEAFAL